MRGVFLVENNACYICLIIVAVIIIVLFIIRKFIYIRRAGKFYPEYNSPLQVERINRELKGAGFEFDPEQEIFLSRHDAWQRKYGYRNLLMRWRRHLI